MVIALDKNKRPLGFITERRARKLMEKKRACLYRVFPAVVIIKDVDARKLSVPECRVKIDPGSKYTGIAIVRTDTNEVMFYAQIEHRGVSIHEAMLTRSQTRRNRRTRETRYRRCKFKKGEYDSSRKKGWLPPSVKSVADNITSWVKTLKKYVNITSCSFEAVRIDTQLMDNPGIEGIEYQQGELFGYEVKEYLLDKYQHECQYCHGKSKDPVLEWEHKTPKSRGGSNSMKNATLACHTCNSDKDDRTPEEWLKALKASGKTDELTEARIEGIQNVIDGKTGGSNRYCAWVTSTRRYAEKYLYDEFGEDSVECSSGGRTKYNRITLGLPKDHHYDALSVGTVPGEGYIDRTNGYVLYIKAMGRGNRLRGNINKCGIIVTKYKDNAKTYKGFMTGDIVTANVPDNYKHHGRMYGRIAIRKTGNFDIKEPDKKKHNVKCDFCKVIQKADGYNYHYGKA